MAVRTTRKNKTFPTTLSERLPTHWACPRVDEVGRVQLGRQRSPENRSGQYSMPYIRAANITWDGLSLDDVMAMDFVPRDRAKYSLRDGDVLLAEASGSAAHVGRPAIWRGEIEDCCFQNTVIRFQPYDILSEYAYLVFRYYAETGEFAHVSRGVGIQHLGAARFASLPFPLPPLEEQQRIVAQVTANMDRLARAKEELHQAAAKISSQRTMLLRDATTGKHTSGEADLPAGWSVTPLGSVCLAINGRAFHSREWKTAGVPIVRIQNLKDPSAPYNYYDGEIDEKYEIQAGDLLFAWSGTPGTSFGAFLWPGPNAVLNQHIFKLIPSTDQVDTLFLFYALNALIDVFVAKARGGGGLAHITRPDFLETPIVLPPLTEQERIASFLRSSIEAQDRHMSVVERNLSKIDVMRRTLLEKAVTGGLNTADVSDVPATQLLHQIKQRTISRAASTQPTRTAEQTSLSFSNSPAADIAPKTRRSLTDVLRQIGPLSAQDLLEQAGYRADVNADVNEFYDALRTALRNQEVGQDSQEDGTRRLLKVTTS